MVAWGLRNKSGANKQRWQRVQATQKLTKKNTEENIRSHNRSLFFDSWWVFFSCLFPRKPGSGTVRLGGKASRCCLISRSPTWGPEPQTQIHLHGKLSSSPYKNQTPRTSQASSKSFEDLMKGILRTFPFGVGSDSHDTRCYQDAITSSPQENRQWANKSQQCIGS